MNFLHKITETNLNWGSFHNEKEHKYGSFEWKPEILAKLILSYRWILTYKSLTQFIFWINGKIIEDYYSKNPEISSDISKEKMSESDKKILEIYEEFLEKYQVIQWDSLTFSKEKEILEAYQNEWDKSKKRKILEKLLSYHYSMIIALACKMSENKEKIEELVQIGLEAIMKRIDNYDSSSRFSKFCLVQAFSEMNRLSDEMIIYIPYYILLKSRKIDAILSNTQSKWNVLRKDFLEKISQELEVSLEEASELLEYSEISFEKFYDNQLYGEEKSDKVLESIIFENLLENLHANFYQLEENEKNILLARYGLNEEEQEYTLDEIWDKIWLSNERIRQIQRDSLEKLRILLKKNVWIIEIEKPNISLNLDPDNIISQLHALKVPLNIFDSEITWDKFAKNHNIWLNFDIVCDYIESKMHYSYMRFLPKTRIKIFLWSYSGDELIDFLALKREAKLQPWKVFAKMINKQNPYKYLPEDFGDLKNLLEIKGLKDYFKKKL